MSKGRPMSADRQYELIYITPPDTTDEVMADLHQQVASIVERFNGKIERTEPWGRRRLAYEINKQREGNYVLEVIQGPAALNAELDRRLRVLDVVMRHLIVRVDEDLAVAERAKARRKAATVSRRVRRGLPPEPTETELHRRNDDDDDMEGGLEMGFRGGRDQ
jgi:small subunit ribosomal protein S6